MLRITLYKNCILNETYQNVISTGLKNGKSVLERYLETLSQFTITDIDDAYYTDNNVLNIDLELVNNANIYEYNYMKILYFDEEEHLKLTRYCFVNDIKVKNEIVQLYYKEDIFSSYSNDIKGIQESYLSKSRVISYSNKILSPYKLPINYDGNKTPLINSLIQLTTNSQYYLLAEIQMYELGQGGTYTKREVKYLKLNNRVDTHGISRVAVEEFIIKIVENMSAGFIKKVKTDAPYTVNYYSYEIGDIYLFPCALLNSNIGQSGSYNYSFTTDNQGSNDFGYCKEILGEPNLTLKQTFTLQLNFKNKFIGTLNNLIEIEHTGLSNEIKVYFAKNDYNITVYIGFQNQLIDITESYKIDVPVKSLLSEELSQIRIARELKNANLSYEKKSTISSMITNMISSIGKGIGQFATKNYGGVLNTAVKGIGNITNSSFKLQNIEENRKAINEKMYSSNSGVFGNSANMVNATLGLIILTIDSVNDNYVKKSINNFGYETFEFISNLNEIDFNNVDFFDSNNINYNSIKFESINVYGYFTNEIAFKLNEILLSGVKIWYNENLSEDNLI